MSRFYQRTTKEIPDIEQPAVDYLERRGWHVEKVVSLSRKGFPDRFCARAGRVVLCEFKAPGEEPNAQQQKRHRDLRKAGVEVVWFDNLEAVYEFFR